MGMLCEDNQQISEQLGSNARAVFMVANWA